MQLSELYMKVHASLYGSRFFFFFCPFLCQRIIEGIQPQCYDYSNISHVAWWYINIKSFKIPLLHWCNAIPVAMILLDMFFLYNFAQSYRNKSECGICVSYYACLCMKRQSCQGRVFLMGFFNVCLWFIT